MAEKKESKLGPTGEAVRANVTRLRTERNLGYAELSRKLETIGRSIPTLGLRRLESGERRVDVDELVALALALDVSPVTLLMPVADSGATRVPIDPSQPTAKAVWKWLRADEPLSYESEEKTRAWFLEQFAYMFRSRPAWNDRIKGSESPEELMDEIERVLAGDKRRQDAIEALEAELAKLEARVDRGDD